MINTAGQNYKQEITNVLYIIDRSGSMNSYWSETVNALKSQLRALQAAAIQNKIETRVTIRTFDDILDPVDARFNDVLVNNLDIESVLSGIYGRNWTALWSSVDSAVSAFRSRAAQRDDYAKNVYLVNILTDGGVNQGSRVFLNKDLAADPVWTFTASCPPGLKHAFTGQGFDVENVTEWEGTRRGAEDLGFRNTVATSNYMSSRAAGVTKSSTFYTDASQVTKKDLNSLNVLNPKIHEVKKEGLIREVVEDITGQPYTLGQAAYLLQKREKIQPQKNMYLYDKITKKFYGDSNKASVREILGLKSTGEIRVQPGNHSNFDIYVTSGSVNRILPKYTKIALVG